MRGRRQILELFERWDRRPRKIALADLMQSLGRLVIKASDLAEVIGFDDQAYLRTVIHCRDHYQAMVLCWQSGQSSPIHDHHGSNCAVRVVSGRATETRYCMAPCGRIRPAASVMHGPGSVTGCSGDDIHQMANLEKPGSALITLHVYSPAPAGWHSYPVCDTSLADDDRLIECPARTVRADLEHPASAGPIASHRKGAILWRR
jgi:cysteine dioxygenase